MKVKVYNKIKGPMKAKGRIPLTWIHILKHLTQTIWAGISLIWG